MCQAQDPQSDKKPTQRHINAPSLSDFAFKEETRMRWFVLYVTTALSLILIGADLTFAFINHDILALVPSPLIAALWIPMVRHLFPGKAKVPKGTIR